MTDSQKYVQPTEPLLGQATFRIECAIDMTELGHRDIEERRYDAALRIDLSE